MKKINAILKKYIPYLFTLIPLVFVSRIFDNDFWFQINHGRYILENGFINIEPFTVHTGLSFSFEKWLTCVIFYFIFSNFGSRGTIVIVYVLCAIIEYLFYKASFYISNNKKTSIILTVLNCSLLFFYFGKTRPQLFSFILLILEFIILEHYTKTNNHKYLIALPFLSIIYMQFHSTMWLIFFVMMLPYLCDLRFINKKLALNYQDYSKIPLLFTALICFGVGIINPYGFASLAYPFKELGIGSYSIISELKTLNVTMLLATNVFILSCLIYALIKKIKLPLRYIYFLSGTFILECYAIRNIAYFIMYGGIISAYIIKDVAFKIDEKTTLAASFMLVPILLVFISLPYNYYKNTHAYQILNDFSLQTHIDNKEIKLYTSFNTGSYAEWIGFKTYIDPRAEVFIKEINNKEDILQEFIDVHYGLVPYQKLQDKYNFDYWLVEKNSAINTYMSLDNNYKEVLNDQNYTIYSYIG